MSRRWWFGRAWLGKRSYSRVAAFRTESRVELAVSGRPKLTCEDSVTFEIYDEDWGKSDDFLGMCTLRFQAAGRCWRCLGHALKSQA